MTYCSYVILAVELVISNIDEIPSCLIRKQERCLETLVLQIFLTPAALDMQGKEDRLRIYCTNCITGKK